MATPAKSSAAPRECCLLRTGFPSDLFVKNEGQFSHPGNSSPHGRCHSGGLSSSSSFIESIIKFQAVCGQGVSPGDRFPRGAGWVCCGWLLHGQCQPQFHPGQVAQWRRPLIFSCWASWGGLSHMAARQFIPVGGQEGDVPLALSLASLLPEPCSSQSFAPGSTALSESQPGFKHLGIMSPGVPEPTEQLVMLSWTHSHAPCSARELAPGSCESLGAMSISQPKHCWPGSAALWHGMAECHLPASPCGPGPLPMGHRRAASKCW